jgi:hypothetical protein
MTYFYTFADPRGETMLSMFLALLIALAVTPPDPF